MTRPLLVYDGRRRPFRRAAALAGRALDVRPVAWESPAAQAFLDAQFDGRPFAFLLVEDGTVHAGAETVSRLVRRADGTGTLATGPFERLYRAAAAPFGRAVHGEAPADLHGSFRVRPAARPHVEAMRSGYDIPVEPAD